MLNNNLRSSNSFLTIDLTNKRSIFILIGLCFIFYYPIIYGSGLYADDVSRINVSNAGFVWHRLGRPLAKSIAQFYSADMRLIIDASPLSWLLSISLIASSTILIYSKLNSKYKTYALPLALVFIINPFFIENLLYRFDNLGMFLGLFLVVLSFSIQNHSKWNITIKIITLVLSMNFYQTFSNIFLSLVAVEAALMAYNNDKTKNIIKYLIVSFLIFILANIFYYLELKILGTPRRGELIPLSISSISIIFNNYYRAFQHFINFWSYFKYFIYPIIPFIVFSFFIISRSWKKTFITLLSLIVILFSTIGLMALLKNPPFFPRSLHFFSPLLMLATALIIAGRTYFKWVMLLPLFACLIFSYRVGNMQKLQREFETPIAYNLTLDMAENKHIKKYYSIGSLPYSNYIKNIIKNTPYNGFMKRGGWITVGVINEYAPKNLLAFEWSSQARKTRQRFNEESSSMTLIVDRAPFYKIYKNDNHEGWVVWQ